MGIAERLHCLRKKKRQARSVGDSYMKLYNHLANYSCFMYRKPRKWMKQQTIKETLQEDWKRLEQDWIDL